MKNIITSKMVDSLAKYLIDISKLFAGAFFVTPFVGTKIIDSETTSYLGLSALCSLVLSLIVQRLANYLDGEE